MLYLSTESAFGGHWCAKKPVLRTGWAFERVSVRNNVVFEYRYVRAAGEGGKRTYFLVTIIPIT